MAALARSSAVICVCAAGFFAFSLGRSLVEVTTAPNATISPTQINLGTVTVGQTPSGIFTLTNSGSSTLIVRNVKSSCDCGIPRLDHPNLPPGDSEPLTVTLHPNTPGTHLDQIVIQTNDPHHPALVVTVFATAVP